MDSAILVLLIMAVGYSVSNYLPLQYRMAKLSGYRQYGAIILYGFCALVAVAPVWYFISIIIDPIVRNAGFGFILSGFAEFVSDEIYAISIIALVASFVVPYLNSMRYGDEMKKKHLLLEINRKNPNELDIFLLKSALFVEPLLLITDAGKVYFGWVVETYNFLDAREDQYIKILPFESGYQTGHLQVVFNTDYVDAYDKEMESVIGSDAEKLDALKAFEKVIPRRFIRSANFFDKDKYNEYFKGQLEQG